MTETIIDLGIARGIDYYTGIVFEIDVPKLGAEKQVCGGGEYSLDELFGLKDSQSSGFAIGFDRLVLANELEGKESSQPYLDIFIVPLNQPSLNKAIELSNQLRSAGFKVEFDVKNRNMSKNLKFASSRNTKFAIFIGDDELKNDTALIRAMATGEQNNIKFVDLCKYFEKLL
jgi:histidyl-tRNA synthetase